MIFDGQFILNAHYVGLFASSWTEGLDRYVLVSLELFTLEEWRQIAIEHNVFIEFVLSVYFKSSQILDTLGAGSCSSSPCVVLELKMIWFVVRVTDTSWGGATGHVEWRRHNKGGVETHGKARRSFNDGAAALLKNQLEMQV